SFGVESNDAGSAIRIGKPLGDEADATPSDRLSKIGVVAHVAQVKLIDHRRAEGFRVAESDELRTAGGQRVKTWNTGAALRNRIGVVEIEIVYEIVGREQPPSRARVDAR